MIVARWVYDLAAKRVGYGVDGGVRATDHLPLIAAA